MSPKQPVVLRRAGSCAPSEWIFCIGLAVLCVSLAAIARMANFRPLDKRYAALLAAGPRRLNIDIRGCVQKPGLYEIQEGASLGAVLKRARPKPYADLSGFSLDALLEKPCSLTVPALEWIEVVVAGHVQNPGTLRLPAGSRVCDVKKILRTLPLADEKLFDSRRLLGNGEILTIFPRADFLSQTADCKGEGVASKRSKRI